MAPTRLHGNRMCASAQQMPAPMVDDGAQRAQRACQRPSSTSTRRAESSSGPRTGRGSSTARPSTSIVEAAAAAEGENGEDSEGCKGGSGLERHAPNMPGAGRWPNPRTVKKRSGASERAADRTQGRTAATRAPPNGSHGRRAAVKPAPRPRRAEADRSFDDTAARHGGLTPSATARVRLNIESCSTLIRSELRGCLRVTRRLTVDYA